MKPRFLKIEENKETSFDVRHEKASYFNNPWHFHPEMELTFLLQSTGMRFVGDSVERFRSGELVLLGSNVPHYWRNDERFYRPRSRSKAEAIILRFQYDFAGKQFMELPEMNAIKQLFVRALQGILFGKKISSKLKPVMLALSKSKGIDRMTLFFEIFKSLSQTRDFRVLSTKIFGGSNRNHDSDRIHQVLDHIHSHLHERIKLEDVAAIANMNITAFCRYLKAQTNKTFVALLNEIRISNACRLLLESSQNISEISYACGFDNVTHFNYTFKKIIKKNPTSYRRQYQ
jgi:AraC-like DNA-binding protein